MHTGLSFELVPFTNNKNRFSGTVLFSLMLRNIKIEKKSAPITIIAF